MLRREQVGPRFVLTPASWLGSSARGHRLTGLLAWRWGSWAHSSPRGPGPRSLVSAIKDIVQNHFIPRIHICALCVLSWLLLFRVIFTVVDFLSSGLAICTRGHVKEEWGSVVHKDAGQCSETPKGLSVWGPLKLHSPPQGILRLTVGRSS